MLTLSNLSPNPGSTRPKKRIGRGPGSGRGKTATRGHKGFKARSGSGIKVGFEGGQMPIQRRLPKRGFTNIFAKEYGIVNVQDLERFDAGATVNRDTLVSSGLVAGKFKLVKVLGNGEITKALTVSVDKLSESARSKILAAGGNIEG